MALARLTVAELRSAERKPGEEFEGLFVLRKCASRTARNDSTYLAVELGDRTGAFSTNVFSGTQPSGVLASVAEGSVLWLHARIEFYQDRFSPKLIQLRVVAESELAALGGVESLVEASPESPVELRARLASLIERIGHPALRATVEGALKLAEETFYTAPAAVSMHHAYRGGLLEHTVHVAGVAAALLPLYPEVNADLALAGAILHDIGKATEYQGTLAPRKTRTGQLQGHVVLGYRLVRRAGMTARLEADLLERLEHIILSHQGELEWGAAVMAATPEAVFVSLADNFDAKMGMVQRALRNGGADEFSEYLPGLKSALLRVPAGAVVPPGPREDTFAGPAEPPSG